jgi:hypothetical protein
MSGFTPINRYAGMLRLKLIDRAGVFRVYGCQFSGVFENLLPRRDSRLITGLVQFGTPEDGHLNRIVPVRQKEYTGCLLGHVRFWWTFAY